MKYNIKSLEEFLNENSNFDYHINVIKDAEDYLALNGMESVGEIEVFVNNYLSDREIKPDDEKLITSLEFFKNRLGEKPNPKSTQLGKYLIKNKLAESVNENYSINEAYNGPYKKVVTKVYKKDKWGEPYNDWENLAFELGRLGFDSNITLAKLVKDPKFSELAQNYQDDILKVTGVKVKGSKNAAFVKEFVSALSNFGTNQGYGDERDIEEKLYIAGSLKTALKNGDFLYDVWNNLNSRDRKSLQSKYGFFGDISKTLDPKEVKFMEKFAKPKVEAYIKTNFTDQKVQKWLQYELGSRNEQGTEEYYFSGTSWTQDAMKKPLEFVKSLIEDGKKIDWNKFEVKREMLGSEHSEVVSSSFSTTYYYKVKLTINGKTFNLPKVAGGSDYYSGGWN